MTLREEAGIPTETLQRLLARQTGLIDGRVLDRGGYSTEDFGSLGIPFRALIVVLNKYAVQFLQNSGSATVVEVQESRHLSRNDT